MLSRSLAVVRHVSDTRITTTTRTPPPRPLSLLLLPRPLPLRLPPPAPTFPLPLPSLPVASSTTTTITVKAPPRLPLLPPLPSRLVTVILMPMEVSLEGCLSG
jgi:hypothetical protein